MNNSIIICSIVRNAEKGLRWNIPVIENLCRFFHEYKIYVYENDSTDHTKELLTGWQKRDPEHVYISLNNTCPSKTIPSAKVTGNVNPFFSKLRISKMISLRNHYMDYIEANHWDADYLMVVDLDVAQLYLKPILSSFSSDVDWDAVTAFGYSLSPKLKRRYHDTYALTEYGDENNPQTEFKIKALADSYGYLNNVESWKRVYSAFGGLAIYKYEAVKGLRYQLIDNDDERVEVRCEHFSICKQMADRGYDKVYINPIMRLKYQALSMQIIFNHILCQWGKYVEIIRKFTPPSSYWSVDFISYCYDGDQKLKAA